MHFLSIMKKELETEIKIEIEIESSKVLYGFIKELWTLSLLWTSEEPLRVVRVCIMGCISLISFSFIDVKYSIRKVQWIKIHENREQILINKLWVSAHSVSAPWWWTAPQNAQGSEKRIYYQKFLSLP